MRKTFLEGIALVFLGIALVFAAVWGIDAYIVRPTFQDLEHRQAVEDAARVNSAILDAIDNLGRTANDWAYWDDTYRFAQDRNQEYIASNYPSPTLVSKNSMIDLLVIFDGKGQMVLQGNYHPEFQQQVPLDLVSGSSPSLAALVAPIFRDAASVDGLVRSSHGVMLLAARQILPTAENGPAQGVLVMGRFLTSSLQDELAARVGVQFTLLDTDDSALLAAEQDIVAQLKSAPQDQQGMLYQNGLYQLLYDVEKVPVLLLRSSLRGDIQAVGVVTGNYLKIVLLLVALSLLICLTVYRARMKISQESLLESEERYRALFANKHIVMLLIDPETTCIVDANPAASRFYGWSGEELRGMKIGDINTLPEAEIRLRMQQVHTENYGHFLLSHRKADGSVCEVEVYSGPLAVRGKKLLYSIVHDVSARRQAENALRESYVRLQTIMNSIDSVIYIADLKTHELLFVNEKGQSVIGSEGVGRKCWEALQNGDGPCGFCTNDKLVNGSGRPAGPCRWEFQNRKHGRWYDITDHAIQWADDRMVRMEIATDITERKHAEEKRFELERQLQQAKKVESLGRMAGAVAHHYNNLLGAVIGNLELAMLDLPALAGPGKNLAAALAAARRATEIGKLMLDYLGQSFAVRKPMDLTETCRQQLLELQAGMPPHVTLSSAVAVFGMTIEGNAEQIGKVLTNLVANGVESMENRPGRIVVGMRAVSAREIPSAHRFPADCPLRAERYVCLEVADEGCGIHEGEIEKIFDPFYSTRFTGRGLGLPVVAGIVKAHDGCIAVESERGRGSVFRIFLPLVPADLPLRTSTSLQEAELPRSGTVLVVEDEPVVREMAEQMIRRLGMQALSARDGVEALEIFQSHAEEIRCVVSDLTMPRMDGWETLEAIRRLSPGIPFVLASGHDQAKVMVGNHPEVPQMFLHKPYGMEALNRALIKAMADGRDTDSRKLAYASGQTGN